MEFLWIARIKKSTIQNPLKMFKSKRPSSMPSAYYTIYDYISGVKIKVW